MMSYTRQSSRISFYPTEYIHTSINSTRSSSPGACCSSSTPSTTAFTSSPRFGLALPLSSSFFLLPPLCLPARRLRTRRSGKADFWMMGLETHSRRISQLLRSDGVIMIWYCSSKQQGRQGDRRVNKVGLQISLPQICNRMQQSQQAGTCKAPRCQSRRRL